MEPKSRVEVLYRKYGASIYGRCKRILGEDAAAEDAAQETFIRAYKYLARAPDGPEAKLWLFRIATSVALDHIRSSARRTRREEGALPETPSRSAEELLADRDLASHFIALAPPKLRPTAWLHYVDGLAPADVAEALGVTRRTVDNHLAAFIASAREQMNRKSL